MPDITMCKNKTCPLRTNCYRHEATPSDYQSYAAFEYRDWHCYSFIPMEGEREKEIEQ